MSTADNSITSPVRPSDSFATPQKNVSVMDQSPKQPSLDFRVDSIQYTTPRTTPRTTPNSVNYGKAAPYQTRAANKVHCSPLALSCRSPFESLVDPRRGTTASPFPLNGPQKMPDPLIKCLATRSSEIASPEWICRSVRKIAERSNQITELFDLTQREAYARNDAENGGRSLNSSNSVSAVSSNEITALSDITQHESYPRNDTENPELNAIKEFVCNLATSPIHLAAPHTQSPYSRGIAKYNSEMSSENMTIFNSSTPRRSAGAAARPSPVRPNHRENHPHDITQGHTFTPFASRTPSGYSPSARPPTVRPNHPHDTTQGHTFTPFASRTPSGYTPSARPPPVRPNHPHDTTQGHTFTPFAYRTPSGYTPSARPPPVRPNHPHDTTQGHTFTPFASRTPSGYIPSTRPPPVRPNHRENHPLDTTQGHTFTPFAYRTPSGYTPSSRHYQYENSPYSNKSAQSGQRLESPRHLNLSSIEAETTHHSSTYKICTKNDKQVLTKTRTTIRL